MAKTLTHGFDVVAHVTQEAVERVFRAYYWMGSFPPDHVTEPFTRDGRDESFEIFFDQPDLAFTHVDNTPNAIRVTFPFLVRLTTHNDEFAGTAAITVAAQKQNIIDGSTEATVIFISFDGAGTNEFSFDVPNLPEFHALVAPKLVASLVSVATPIILTPPAAPNAGFFAAKLYPKTNDGFLGIFVNFEDVERDEPSDVDLYGAGGDVKTAVPAEHVNTSIARALEDMGLDHFPASLSVEGESYTVNALSITLRDGHIYVSGNIDDVDFKAWLGLTATDDGLEAVSLSTQFDMPWWLDVANAFSAGAIQRAIEEGLPKALENVSTGALSGVSVFSRDLPGADFLIRVKNKGNVKIKKTGIILSSDLEAEIDAQALARPTYLKANTDTKEFHRDGCTYGQRLKWQRSVRLINERAALRQGYNGCFTCAREFSFPMARVIFGFFSPSPPVGVGDVLVEVEGKLIEPVVVCGVDVADLGFSRKLSLKRRPDEDGSWSRFDHLSSNELMPGVWQFDAHAEGWNGKCVLRLRKTATHFGSTNYIAFRWGNPDGAGGYDKMPEFPI